MSSTPIDPEKFERFMAWAQSNGITYNKIAPIVFPDAGLGMVSTGPIAGARQRTKYESSAALSAGDAIAFTPAPLLVTRENLDKFSPGIDWRALLKEHVNDDRGLTTHAAFATAIAREAGNAGNPWKPWMDVFPTMQEFAKGLPILWSEEESSLLPPSTRYLLEKQVKKFEWDYQVVKSKGFSFPREYFLWAWLVVNTRCLFYKPETNEYKAIGKGDCMALCPFIDFFNHSDQGCQVQFSTEGFSVSPAPSAYPESSQVFVSYGCHSNDFLLVEYGFILPSERNRWDDVSVTSLVLPKLSPAHRGILEEEGFLGDYHFDGSAFCFRTQAAARLLNIQNPRSAGMYRKLELWRRFISGLDDGERDGPAVAEFLLSLLGRLQFAAEEALEKIGALENEQVVRVLTARWEQILGMKTAVRRDILKGGGGDDREGD